MKIFLYSLNYAPELTGIGKYNGDMATTLSQLGCDVTIITAPPYYPEWAKRDGFSYNKYKSESVDSLRIYRCPIYVPNKVTTLKRILHLLSFAICSGMRLLTLVHKRPDVVLVVQPTFFCAPLTLLFCKLAGAKSIMHIQDFELDAMLGLGMGKRGWFIKLFKRVERWLLLRFDMVSTISHSMLEKAKGKGVSSLSLLFYPNWADIDFVTPRTCGKNFKSKLGYKESDKIVLYAGNIGKKQGLEIVLQAAKNFYLQPDVKFLIVGNGANLNELKLLAERLSLTNCRFLPLQKWEDVPSMLAMADIHLIIQRAGAADAVLPSKLTNILAVGGNAIVTAEANTELGHLAEKYPGIYSLIEPENTSSLVNAIRILLSNGSKGDFNKVARAYAEENLDKNVIIRRFVGEIKERLLK